MSTVVFIGVLVTFILGYKIYGGYLSKLLEINKDNPTPAIVKYDGSDFVPAKNWMILFGHHFASIAGAGPIVGPVLAYMSWGWLGTLLWIVLGTIFMGGIHDFLSLVISVREGGQTIGNISKEYISLRASKVFLGFLWFALVIVIAVFASLCAKSFISQPEVVLPSLGLIPVAIFVGILIYNLRVNTAFSTLIGLILLFLLVLGGELFKVKLNLANPYLFWIIVLFLYAFFASILPVNILLQPRDYISSFLLFFGIGVSLIGLFIRPFPIRGAVLFKYSSSLGPLFPVMFITVACGAISGFHSLVSSGTTSKQISSELHAKRIGLGAMVLEGVLATIALFSVAFVLKNPPNASPMELFSLGFSKIAYFLGDYGKVVALVILNAFILTTLDSATRITRFITQELGGIKNKWVATTIVILTGGYLGLTGQWQILWPIFGASNQLVAALALIVISAWLISKKKNFKVAVIPAIIMLTITTVALALSMVKFFTQGNWLLFGISLALLFMAGLVVDEFIRLKLRVSHTR